MTNIVGINIKRIRKERNLTQQELANKLQIERSAISRIETGSNDINSNSLYQFAKALKVDIMDFYKPVGSTTIPIDATYEEFTEYLPYLLKASNSTLMAVRKLLDMPQAPESTTSGVI